MEEANKMRVLAGLTEGKKDSSKKELSMIEVVNKFDYLAKAFKYIVLNNKSNLAPYHNINHLLTVTNYTYKGILSTDLIESDSKELLLTAIFHDFNHSAGKKKDDENIKVAKAEIRKFIELEKIEGIDLEEVDSLLDATQFPYVLEKKDLNIKQAIIRDADLMQIFEYNWIQQNIFGLATELNLGIFEFLKSQKKFLENCEFNTDYGRELKEEKWKQVMREFDALEKICGTKLESEK